ncbi:hypothetical protein RJJ37_07240 [Rhizobium redzepovicii]|uniref:Hedgehog/Intein (Hint) domain-containing protein n=1 Tax=Rhizobium redzepovicii TaxID=2867518 RepID=A0AAW8NXK5_9HYPH|nr:hypothetical protein [Rhizobium redzepovicii]MDR9759427.1 hypothetical protein [Rhizobium redzepovicii]
MSRKMTKRPAASGTTNPEAYSEPLPTLKCGSKPIFRSKAARDLACILDTNTDVATWFAPGPALTIGALAHVPDFRIVDRDETVRFVDAPGRVVELPSEKIEAVAREQGASYRLVSAGELYDGFRVRNARDLLRYAHVHVTLADRLRLLAVLDQEGSLSMADCFGIVRHGEPVATVASLILHGFLEVDLDEALLSPESFVRRIRN